MAADPLGAALDWGRFTTITTRLAREVTENGIPDVIVGIQRGGLVPAVLLAHALGVRDVRAIDVTHTVSDDRHAAKTPEPTIRDPRSVGDLTGQDVLVVDDIAGTGHTLAATRDLIAAASAMSIRTATCVVNDLNWARANPGDPLDALTYVGARYQGWVIFPWETQ